MSALWKRWQSKNSKTLSMITIVVELGLLKKTVAIHWNVRKKYLLSFTIKLIEKIPDPSKTKECYQSYLKKKIKNW